MTSDNKKKKYSNVDEVYKRLQSYLASSPYAEGERIPPEREIAESLNVNRTTLRAAMHKLVESGYLERRIGAGTFTKVTTTLLKNIDNQLGNFKPSELVEIRIMLEPQIAMMAATNASLRDIDLLKEISEVESDEEALKIESSDIDFNEHLAKISGNGLLQRLYNDVSTVRRKLKPEISSDTNQLQTSEKNNKAISYTDAERWLMHQQKVIQALENHLAKAAEEAVRNKLADLLFNQFSVIKRADIKRED